MHNNNLNKRMICNIMQLKKIDVNSAHNIYIDKY